MSIFSDTILKFKELTSEEQEMIYNVDLSIYIKFKKAEGSLIKVTDSPWSFYCKLETVDDPTPIEGEPNNYKFVIHTSNRLQRIGKFWKWSPTTEENLTNKGSLKVIPVDEFGLHDIKDFKSIETLSSDGKQFIMSCMPKLLERALVVGNETYADKLMKIYSPKI